ncbi:MAG: folylpolyglutamate synthase/dihydrofolate synthase family protein [Desulfobacterales bacterium]
MPVADSYRNCLNEMYALRRFGIKLGLDVIRRLLTGLGNPQEHFNSIHVAGTNGKGSVAATLASILTARGFRTGLYTSPHLVRFNERIVVDRQTITDDNVLANYQAVKTAAKGDREPTFFECATAMAFREFKRRRVEWALIETGMGGRLDATNIIHPALSIITNVSLEHREYLGRTISRIAGEKAGIIKTGVPVVTAVRQRTAIAVVETVAAQHSAPLFRLGKDFRVRHGAKDTIAYDGLKVRWRGLKMALRGGHQLENTALALAACEVLTPVIGAMDPECLQRGLSETRWPGRLEQVLDRPLTLLDGAHNLIAARALGRYLKTGLAGRAITLVIGILDDKPYREILAALVPHCRRVILTRPKTHRALPPELLIPVARTLTTDLKMIPDVAEAVSYAIESAAPDDVVCVAGSLYVVGEAKAALEKLDPPEPV